MIFDSWPEHEDARQRGFGRAEEKGPSSEQQNEEFEGEGDEKSFAFGLALHQGVGNLLLTSQAHFATRHVRTALLDQIQVENGDNAGYGIANTYCVSKILWLTDLLYS